MKHYKDRIINVIGYN